MAPKQSLRQRLRQRQQSQSEWMHAFYENHFTPLGKALLLATICSLSLGLSGLELPLYILALNLVGFFMAVLLQGYIHRPQHLHLQAEPMYPVTVGNTAYLRLILTYTGSLNLYHIDIHGRFVRRANVHLCTSVAMVPVLHPGQTLSLTLDIPPTQRGEYPLLDAVVYSSFPFGLFKWMVKQPLHGHLLVYPDYKPLKHIALRPGRKYQVGGIFRQEHQGESVEFVGVRQFTAGDNPRHVHWPSLAKTGKLHVKEFHEEYFIRLALMLEVDEHPLLENSISLLAALGDWVLKQGYHLELLLLNEDPYILSGGHGRDSLEYLLNVLAKIQPSTTLFDPDRLLTYTDELQSYSMVLGILSHWNKGYIPWLQNWRTQGISYQFWVLEPTPDGLPLELSAAVTHVPSGWLHP